MTLSKLNLKDEGNPLDYVSRTVINGHVCAPSVLLLRNIVNYTLPCSLRVILTTKRRS